MEQIRSDMEGALNSFLADQKTVPGDCEVTLVQFDTDYDIVWENRDIKTVPSITIRPRGATALLDAVGKTINRLGQNLAALPEDQRPEKVLVVIITDGRENSSFEFSRQHVREMIQHQEEKYGWAFSYLGANQDSFEEALTFGIAARGVSNYGANYKGTQTLSSTLSAATTRMRGAVGQSASASYAFTEEEQDAGDKTTSGA